MDNNIEKKVIIGIIINIIILILGLSSIIIEISKTFLYKDNFYGKFYDVFRYFTIDGNLYTIISIIILLINIKKENNKLLYYFSLSSVVSEFIIFIVIIFIIVPFTGLTFINSYTGMSLHIFIPLLFVFRFLYCEYKILHNSSLLKLSGSFPVLIYGFIISILISFNIIENQKIPYDFLKYNSNPIWLNILIIILFPTFTIGFSFLFDYLNFKFGNEIKEQNQFEDSFSNKDHNNTFEISDSISHINDVNNLVK